MPSKQKRIDAAKQLRKLLQYAIANVDLDADDVSEVVMMVDPWVPNGKYKTGMLATDDNAVWRCTKNVNKSETKPADDAEHWQRADLAGDGVEVWTEPTGKGYTKGDRVHYPDSDGPVYISQKNNNTVVPGTDEKYWTLDAS